MGSSAGSLLSADGLHCMGGHEFWYHPTLGEGGRCCPRTGLRGRSVGNSQGGQDPSDAWFVHGRVVRAEQERGHSAGQGADAGQQGFCHQQGPFQAGLSSWSTSREAPPHNSGSCLCSAWPSLSLAGMLLFSIVLCDV